MSDISDPAFASNFTFTILGPKLFLLEVHVWVKRFDTCILQQITGYVAERLSYRHLSSRKRFDLDKVLQNQIPVYETDVELINDDLASIIFVCAVYSNPLSFVEISSNQEQIWTAYTPVIFPIIYPGFAWTKKYRFKSDKKIIRQSTESEDDFEYHWVQIQLKNVKKLSLSCRKGGLSSSLNYEST